MSFGRFCFRRGRREPDVVYVRGVADVVEDLACHSEMLRRTNAVGEVSVHRKMHRTGRSRGDLRLSR